MMGASPAPKGQRECVNCAYYHPERKRQCSAFGTLENRNKDCSLYHEDLTPVAERTIWVGQSRQT